MNYGAIFVIILVSFRSNLLRTFAISRKKEILLKSAALFRKKGFAATSMRDIARNMDMEAASLYNHVSSKQSILTELLMSIADQFIEGMNLIKISDQSAFEKLESIIDQHIDMTISQTDSIALIPNEWIHLEEPHLKRFVMLRKNYEKEFKGIIDQCMKEGSIKEVNIEVVVFSTLSTLRWLYSWYSRRKMNVTKLKKELKKVLLEGLV